jgi:hypothetical protein
MRKLLVLVGFCVWGSSQAASLLISDTDYVGGYFNYGEPGIEVLTQQIDATFDTVSTTTTFEDLAFMLQHDALWVSYPGQDVELSAQEIANIEAYLASGGRVVVQGETTSTQIAWNFSINNLFDGQIRTDGTNPWTGQYTTGPHPLLYGVERLVFDRVGGFSDMGTGLSLTEQDSIGLWNENLLVFMDRGMFSDTYIQDPGADNLQMADNTLQWLATGTVIPIPAAVWLFASALAALGWARRRAVA